jgi:sugar phosphate isomerase/epimerase
MKSSKGDAMEAKLSRLRVGFIDSFSPPQGVNPDEIVEWSVKEAIRLGADIVGGDPRPLFRWSQLDLDFEYLRSVRQFADSNAIEIEPYIRAPFDLVESNADEARAETIASIRAAKGLGGPYVRTAYGRSSIPHSRFSPFEHVTDHIHRLAKNLIEASKIAADEGVIIALENHGDFSGPELAQLFDEVDSEYLRCALDTGNSVAVFSDPVADATALLPWIVTTHMKDVSIIRGEGRDHTPFLACGCAVGCGIVDFPTIVALILTHGPRGLDTPLIVEVSWPRVESGLDPEVERHAMVTEGVRYLQKLSAEIAIN